VPATAGMKAIYITDQSISGDLVKEVYHWYIKIICYVPDNITERKNVFNRPILIGFSIKRGSEVRLGTFPSMIKAEA
jgi:hypothetical protein